MTAPGAIVEATTTPDERPEPRWRSIVFASGGTGATRRRPMDIATVVMAVVVVTASVAVLSDQPDWQQSLADDLGSLPSGLHWVTTTLWYLGSWGVIISLALLALVSRRPRLARDTAVAGVGVWLFGLALGAWFGVTPTATSDFPLLQLAAATSVAVVVMPYLSRPARRLFVTLVVLGALGAILRGTGQPLAVFASLVMGWGFAALVHLAFGSPTGLPSVAEVAAAAAELGYDLHAIEPVVPQPWGVARFGAVLDGAPVDVSVYGRDAADAQLLIKLWRFVWYRDSGPTLVLSRLQEVEHEAFLTLTAAQTGAATPLVVAAGMAPAGRDAVLLTRPPAGRSLAQLEPSEVTPAVVDRVFATLGQLRRARIAHGSISGDTIVVDHDGAVAVRNLRSASVSADAERLDRDLAGALVAVALAVGARHAVDGVGRVLGADALGGALAHLQPAALDRANRARLHHEHKHLLNQLRDTGAEELGADVPKLADIHRVSWGSFGMGVGAAVGVYLIVQEFSGIDDLGATLSSAAWGWVLLAFVLAQSTNVAQALSVIGSVSSPLPFGPTLAMELANAFTGLVGGTVGTTATIIRYFQRRGLAVSVAVSSGVLVTLATMVTQTVLFIAAFLMSRGDFDFSANSSSSSSSGDSGSSHTGMFLLLALMAVLAFVGALTFVPRLRHQVANKLRPQYLAARENLENLRRAPGKLVRLFGGAVAAQVLFAMVLGASLHAYGWSLSLAELLVINTLASLLGGIAPVPGGMGVIEAGLIAGFTAAGVPADIAVAATLTARLFTCYLPPIWGYPSLVWMRKKEYL